MTMRTVEIVDHNPGWRAEYLVIAQRLRAVGGAGLD
jgi:GrpB-like predicted nucleotidyltransferase (UPF0157 family)